MCNIFTLSAKPSQLMLFAAFFMWSGFAVSNDDLYLKELEAEVGINTDSATTPSQPKHTPKDDTSGSKITFERKLQQEKPNSFKTYQQLSEDGKIKVIEAYFRSEKDIEAANRLIFDLYYQ